MNEDQETTHAIIRELFAAESSLWGSHIDQDSVREGRQSLRRCIDQLAYRDASCIPDVAKELSSADGALLGRRGAGKAMQSIRRALDLIKTLNNKARLEPGRIVA